MLITENDWQSVCCEIPAVTLIECVFEEGDLNFLHF
jgi:hypothetical protein